MSHVPMIQKAYEAFATGDVPAVLETFHPEIEWNATKGFPWLEKEQFNGHEEVVNGVFAPIPDHMTDFRIEILDFVDGGDKVTMVGRYHGILTATGRPFTANATHTWDVADGKLTRFFQAVDTAAVLGM